MEFSTKFLATILFAGLFLYSCSEDEEPLLNQPVIHQFEFGEGSSHSTDPVAYKGSDIHMAAEIEAEAIVQRIVVAIHAHEAEPTEEEVEWDFEQIYSDARYQVRNPDFHEHIDIPDNIPAGAYHISLTVTDEAGHSTETEGELMILDPVSINDPSIASSVTRGDDFHAEFTIHAVNGIHEIRVDIHAHSLTPEEGEMEWEHTDTYSEGYHGETEIAFHEHIDVPATAPQGEYHMVFTVEDEEGFTQKLDTHIEVTEN